jgi:hypothetical protein
MKMLVVRVFNGNYTGTLNEEQQIGDRIVSSLGI